MTILTILTTYDFCILWNSNFENLKWQYVWFIAIVKRTRWGSFRTHWMVNIVCGAGSAHNILGQIYEVK